MNILLLNGENVQTICAAKSLRKIGCNVIVMSSSKLSSGYFTRYRNKRYIAPSIISDFEGFKEYLMRFLSSTNIDVIIPMGDDSASFLSKYKHQIESNYKIRCAVTDWEVFKKASDKQSLMQLCETFGFPHPRTRGVNYDNLEIVSQYVGFPAMIKPNISAGAKGITKVNTLDELEAKLPDIIKDFGDCTLQQYIEQPPYYYNVMIHRSHSGDITASTIIKISRYFPLKGGTSCYCQTIENEALLKICCDILEKLNWEGFADFDILEDLCTKEYKVIEINPRVPSSLQASVAAGVDFMRLILADLYGEPIPRFEYQTSKEIRWLGLDVMWFIFSKERFNFKPSWFNFWGKNVSYQDGSISDPMPMIIGCIAGVLKYLNPKFRKSKLK